MNVAKKNGFPKQSIVAAIARGQGRSINGGALESVTMEILIPPAIGMMVECQTDNKNRTLQDVRDIASHCGAGLGATAYLFDRRGQATLVSKDGTSTPKNGEEEVLEKAIEVGALDVDCRNGAIVVKTEPGDLRRVSQGLGEALGMLVENEDFIWDPKEEGMLTIKEEEIIARVELLIGECYTFGRWAVMPTHTVTEKLEDEPTVQAVYVNATW